MTMPPSHPTDADDAFDPDYYMRANDDVRAFGFDPTDHYLRFGQAEGRAANARQAARKLARSSGSLDEDQATRVIADLRLASADPAQGGAWPARPAIARADVAEPAVALERVDAAEPDELDARPPGWFDPVYYREQNRDVAGRGLDMFQHYMTHGYTEGRSPNRFMARIAPGKGIKVHGGMADERAAILDAGLFDVRWYAETYQIRPERAIAHYVWMGAFMGNDPSLFFSSMHYIKANPDILLVGLNPLSHYITFGFVEGRNGVRTSETRLTADVWLKGF